MREGKGRKTKRWAKRKDMDSHDEDREAREREREARREAGKPRGGLQEKIWMELSIMRIERQDER